MVDVDESDTWTEAEEGISFYFVVFGSLLALVLVLSKLLHDRPWLASCLPEAGLVIIVGMVVGGFALLFVGDEQQEGGAGERAQSLLSFSPEIFFVVLLPPIIFNSGYHIRLDMFFRHFNLICLFSCVGTIISALATAGVLWLAVSYDLTGDFQPNIKELLTFGALISATDTVSVLAVFQSKRVDPHLFYLVFGESVLNDSVSLVLFDEFAKLVKQDDMAQNLPLGILIFLAKFILLFLGSLLLGVMMGIGAAYLLKTIDMRETTILELSLYILIMYVPFLLADTMHLSGIVTILFTGLAANRYCVPNLSAESESASSVFFRLAAYMAETSIFLEMGLSLFGLPMGNFLWRFTLWALLACLLARACNIYPISFIFNRSLSKKVDPAERLEREENGSHLLHVEQHGLGSKSSESSIISDIHGPITSDCGSIPRSPSRELQKTFKIPMKRKDKKITRPMAHVLWFCGLRGAMAYALARAFPDKYGNRNYFIAVTVVIVLVTIFFFGGLTTWLLNYLNIPVDVNEEEYYMETNVRRHFLSDFLAGFETDCIRRRVIRNFDPSSPDSAGRIESPTSSIETIGGTKIEADAYLQHIETVEIERSTSVEVLPEPHFRRRHSLYDYGYGHGVFQLESRSSGSTR